MKFVVVYNLRSGGNISKATITKKFADAGHSIEKLIAFDDQLEEKLRPYSRKGVTVAVIGGDGTQSAVADLLAGKKAVLVPLAGGTLNHFVKDLGAELTVDAALQNVTKSHMQYVDVGRINDKVFLNNSSIGLYPSSLQVRDKIEHNLGKWPAALVAAAVAFIRFRTYTVTINDQTVKTPFIFIGNNIYRIGTMGVERKKLNEGLLSVFVANATTRRQILKIALLSIFGRAHVVEEFTAYKTTSLTIEARHLLLISRDGELERLQSPLRYTIDPASLKVRF